MSIEDGNLDVNVFWSMRSPYCYIALNRCLEMQKRYHLNLHLKPVYPIALKDPNWFQAAKDMKYRLPYQDIDSFRTAFFNGVPMRYPDPDPVAQEPGEHSKYGKILPFDKQHNIQLLVRTAIGAVEMGKGWEYLNEVMRMVWNGQKRPWNTGDHLRNAIQAAGIDADALLKDVATNPDKYDALIEANEALQLQCDGHHTGVPGFVFRNEPFFGQDRIDMLIWRLKQYGLRVRADYEPSLRAQAEWFGSD
jgi:2-hydroxychromene-2-carboxylate isomerase